MGVCGIDINDQAVILTFGGCISIVCLAIIFYLFYFGNIPNLRRHPTTIAIHKCWFEVIFVSQYLWMSFVDESFFWNKTSDDIDNCQVNPSVWPFSWLTQFSLLGGELWFAVLSIDIHLSLTNPFSSHQANAIYYTGFVYSIAIIMACILVSIIPIKYGLSTDPMIWVHDQKNKTNNIKVAMFYSYMSVIYMYCGCIAYWSRGQISKGLEDTLRVRQYSVSKTTIYVIGYFIFWTLVFVFQFLNYLKTDFDWNFMSNSDGDHLRTVSAFLLASRGIWSLSIFVLANKKEIFGHYNKKKSDKNKSFATDNGEAPAVSDGSPPAEEEELLQLNIVLQKEIVRFTGLGIQKAARDMSIMIEAASSRSSLSSNLNFFGVKMPGESVSFVVVDPDIIKSRENSREPLRNNSVVPTYNDPVNPLLNSHTPAMSAHSPPKYISSSLQSIQPFRESDMERNSLQEIHHPSSLGTQAGSFGAAPQISSDYVEQSDERQKTVSQAEVNFQLENKQMERQFSNASQKSEVTRASTIAKVIHTISNMGRKKRDNFLFTDYSPKRFARIRHLSGIEMADYMESFRATTMPSFSEGKSGAFLYFSCDYKYIVKTTVKSEFEKLLSILPDMEAYLEEEVKQWHKPLITRFFGAHRIIMYDIPLYFVVMQNILPSVDEKYDLKGSWVNRHGSKMSSNPERQRPKKNNQTKEKGSTPLFLDNDLQNCFLIRPDVAKAVVKQIARDTRFLERFNLMDYSLLIGVRRRNFEILDSQTTTTKDLSAVNLQSLQGNPFSQDYDGAFHAAVVEGQGTFYIGIIDVLQEWNWKKYIERMFKIWFLQKDGNGLSAIEPHTYRRRFIQRAVLDVIDGVENMTVDDFEEMIERPTSPLQMSSPGSVRSGKHDRSSITRNQSERDTEAGEGISKSFSSISREPSSYSVDTEFKYKGTDNRFAVTPMSVNKM